MALHCPRHRLRLTLSPQAEAFVCPENCSFAVIGGIPRFVPPNNYASSFGLQWKKFRLSQLDSHTGLSISRDRLTRILGGSLESLAGKRVLEAGCGAGRFTEIMLEAGASVQAVDLSSAVEANYENCGGRDNYSVLQADILRLPFTPEEFDIVVCIGVIQHTENPEKTMETLCSHVKTGGLLAIDHYTYGYAATPSRRILRAFLKRVRNKEEALRFCETMVRTLWPMHSFLWRHRERFHRLRRACLWISPVVDYHGAYPQLSAESLLAWAVLDTHDTLTDYYKHLRSAEEIEACLRKCGMVDIEAVHAGNGVEARARKPRDKQGAVESGS